MTRTDDTPPAPAWSEHRAADGSLVRTLNLGVCKRSGRVDSGDEVAFRLTQRRRHEGAPWGPPMLTIRRFERHPSGRLVPVRGDAVGVTLRLGGEVETLAELLNGPLLAMMVEAHRSWRASR